MQLILGREISEFADSALPVVAVLVPLAGAFGAWFAGRQSEKLRDVLAVVTAALTFLITLVMAVPVMLEKTPILFRTSEVYFGIGMKFAVDPLSWLFAFFTSFVWLAATVYSTAYMGHEHKRNRYYLFLMISLAANMGVLITADFFTLFIFFEALSIFSYPLVIHSEAEEALAAGTKYMVMNILGGVTLLSAILLLFFYTGSFEITPALARLEAFSSIRFLVPILLIAGFGVKAGYVPLHIWLPDAHPVAPTPASALLSGIMIKAGAYGIIRTAAVVFRPAIVTEAAESVSGAAEVLWENTNLLGYGIIWLGILTMLVAAIMALQQTNAKRLLAYSSVSQMGYIIMGIGAGAFLAAEGTIGFSGAVYHVLNHAMFKSTFFLVIGAVYFMTHELDLDKLGGLYRRMPVVAVAGLIAAGGIMGVPLLNGYASKSLLFEGMVEAAKESHLPGVDIAKWLYLFTGSLTTAYILKFIVSVFFGKLPTAFRKIAPPPMAINIGFGMTAAAIVFIGLFPNLVLRAVIAPVVGYWGFETAELLEINFFTVGGFVESFAVIGVGALVYVAGGAAGAFAVPFPVWVSIDYWYQRVAKQVYTLSRAMNWANNTLESGITKIVPWIMRRKPALGSVNSLLSRLLFAFLVDMWLPQPVTPTVRERQEEELMVAEGKLAKKAVDRLAGLGKTAGDRVAGLGRTTSVMIGSVDATILDKFISIFAYISQKISQLVGNVIDPRIVDGIINGIAWITGRAGKALRPTQTGDVQSYGLVMLFGAFLIIAIFALAIFGVIRLPL